MYRLRRWLCRSTTVLLKLNISYYTTPIPSLGLRRRGLCEQNHTQRNGAADSKSWVASAQLESQAPVVVLNCLRPDLQRISLKLTN